MKFFSKFYDYEILAERRQSIGFDWHRECLKCQECGKVLNPGQHAEVYTVIVHICIDLLFNSVMSYSWL